MTGADNQQGSHSESYDPSETKRRALDNPREEIVRAAWRHAEAGRDDRPARIEIVDSGLSAPIAACTSNRSERNSLSGKIYLPRHSVKNDRVPAHIGEALPPLAKGNPEGSPSDPVTTDPKGEAGRSADQARDGSTCNTPALITTRAAYGERGPLDPWFVSGLSEGEGCFCASFGVRPKLRTRLEVRPSFSLSLNETDLELLRDLQTFFGCEWIRAERLPDDRARRSSAAGWPAPNH